MQLDKDIVFETRKRKPERKKGKNGILIFAAVGAAVIIVLLLYQPGNSAFITSPPPGEQAERDSVAAVAARVEAFMAANDSLPRQEELNLPPGFIYTVEYDDIWSVQTPVGLYYTSDMDLGQFERGEL